MPPEEMIIASDEAIQEFRVKIFPTLTKEEKAGIKKLLLWWKAVYLQTGYKLICRFLLQELAKDL